MINLEPKKKNEILDALSQSRNKKEFRKKFPHLFLIAKNSLEFKDHYFFRRPNQTSDIELLKWIKTHKTFNDLVRNDPNLYCFLKKNKKDLLYGVFPKKELPKTDNEIISLLRSYNSIAEFSKKESTLYKKILKNHKNLIKTAFPKELKWNLEKATKEASKYETRSEFKRKSGGCYTWIRENGLLDLICANMKDGYVKRHNKSNLSFDQVKEICSKYKSRTALKKNNHWVFFLAEKNGWIDILLPDLNKTRLKINKKGTIMKKTTKRDTLRELAKTLSPEFSSKELKDLAIKNGINLGINDRTLYDFLSKSRFVSKNKKNNKFFLVDTDEPQQVNITIDELKKITANARESALKNYCQKILIKAKEYALVGQSEFEHDFDQDSRFTLSDVVFELRSMGFKINHEQNSSKIIINW